MTHRYLVFISLLAAAVLPQTAAAGLWQRCQEDVLSTTQAVGRNAWSRKCGYITSQEETELNSMTLYAVYNVGKYGGNPNIPITSGAACAAASATGAAPGAGSAPARIIACALSAYTAARATGL